MITIENRNRTVFGRTMTITNRAETVIMPLDGNRSIMVSTGTAAADTTARNHNFA